VTVPQEQRLDPQRALVLLSGGQDSATALAWALARFSIVDTIGFAYEQRHAVELDCRKEILRTVPTLNASWAKRLGEDRVIDLSVLGRISPSALTRAAPIELTPEGLPSTFVPGRNIVFLSFAAIAAYGISARNIVAGVCQTDFSGYPDCRDDTVKAVQLAVNLGMARQFAIHTPLMWLTKAQTWGLAHELGGDALVELIVRETHTCYMGDRKQLHPWGYGCGSCPACVIRRDGHAQFVTALQTSRTPLN